jgi:hypothetical protein
MGGADVQPSSPKVGQWLPTEDLARGLSKIADEATAVDDLLGSLLQVRAASWHSVALSHVASGFAEADACDALAMSRDVPANMRGFYRQFADLARAWASSAG